jgi:hypothetical protein
MTVQELQALARRAIARWKDDPVLFATEALGVAHIWWRQEELLRAVAVHRKVAVRSGQKTSKTFSIALLSIWWALTRARALVILLAPGQHHLETVLWPEFARLRADSCNRSRQHPDGSPRTPAVMPLGGDFHKSPMTGWEFPNGSRIVGFVTNDPQRLRGISGARNLYIIDEATAIPDPIWSSVDGNLAGGGRVLAVSNPVIAAGWYFQAFGDRSNWHRIAISSIEASEVEPPIEGLATKEFIAEKREEWGEESTEWHAKILGEFPPSNADGCIPRTLVREAQKRWTDRPLTLDSLRIGVDPAHEGRDSTAIVWSRGTWASAPIVLDGWSTVAVAREVVRIIQDHARPNERASVRVDGSSVGAGVVDFLEEFHQDVCEVLNLKAAASSPDPTCSRLRDLLWIGLRKWLAEGAIPPDQALEDDVTAPLLGYDDKLRFKVEDKRSMRKRLGRSTDRADALALAVFDNESVVLDQVFSDAYRSRTRF